MEVRQLQPAEFEEFLTLASFAFQFDWSPEDKEKTIERLESNTVWGVWVDGRLASGMTVIPFESYVYGKPIAMGGIASVASWPEYRRQGHVRALMKDGLSEMYARGQYLSDLFPFKESFYAAFGWERVSRRYTYQMPMSQCPTFSHSGARIRITEDYRELDSIHGSFAVGVNGTHKRTEQWWQASVMRKGYRAVIVEHDGVPDAYLIYKVRDNKIHIREWVALSRAGRQACWSFIANHDSMAETVEWSGLADGRDLFYQPNPPSSINLSLGHMSRIVDMKGFLENHPWNPEHGQTLTIGISDPICPWNHGVWRLGGTRKIEKLEDHLSETGEWDVSCGVGPFTAISLGAISTDQLLQAGKLEGGTNAQELLSQWFPSRPCTSMDFY